MFDSGKRKLVSITQAFFSPKGGLVVQTFISALTRETKSVNVKYVTLDQWLRSAEESTLGRNGNESNAKSKHNISFEDWDDTISCIELEMRRDRSGYLVNWMVEEPREDNWDGSVDNRERTLENHIGKHGWLF